MLIEGPPTAYDRENDLFNLVSDGRIQEAIQLGRTLRDWWLGDDQWTVDTYHDAVRRVSWINGFIYALDALEQSRHQKLIQEIDTRFKPKRKRKTSGGSGKSNQP